jgi:hypothetical protein
MKAKIYIGIITAVLLPGFLAQAQIADSRDYRYDDTRLEVNNYYNYDYYYSSRINRFHRSFATFDYYAPVFTDSYWYNYDPYSWGSSIYGSSGFIYGLSYNYPVYYDYGWDTPYFGGSYYWGYSPFYFNNWYSPVVISISIGNRWPHNYYNWRGHNRWNYDYRPVYNTYNNYYYGGYPSNSSPSNLNYSRRSGNVNTGTSTRPNNVSRRAVNTTDHSNTVTEVNRGNTNNGNRGNNNNLDPGNTNNVNRGNNTNNGNRGNNNNLDPGNTNNVNRGNTNINTNRTTNRSVTKPGNTQIEKKSDPLPARNQTSVTNRSVESGRNVNSSSNGNVSRSVSTSTPVRKLNVTSGTTSGSSKSVTAPARRTITSVKSGTTSKSGSTTSRSSSSSVKSTTTSKSGSGTTTTSSSKGKVRRK